jgi:hypothetical protein
MEGDGVIDTQRELAKPGVTQTDVADKFQDLCVRGAITMADRHCDATASQVCTDVAYKL